MSRLATRDENTLSEGTLHALQSARVKGKLPPVYQQLANSEHALLAYLHMESALKRSSLSLRTVEAIKLAVSEHNQCDFCLSNHHFKSGTVGFSEAQRLAIRRGEAIGEPQLDGILAAVWHMLKHPGGLSEQRLQGLRDQGIDDSAMVDIALAISTITFTNLFNHFNDTDLSLPAAPSAKGDTT